VYGSVTVRSNATVAPGASAGTLGIVTITNEFVCQLGGILSMDADHLSGTNDVISGMNSATFGGTLNLNLFSIDLTSNFKLFDAVAYSGGFDVIIPATPGGGWVWDTSSLTVDGRLKVKPLVVTPPSVSSVAVAGGNLTLSGTGGAPFYTYTVYASSDLSVPLSSWAAVGTGVFKGDGSFVFTIPVNTTTNPQQYYSVQYVAP
jgi:hypothetical protein